MTFEKMPYGANMSNTVYTVFKSWVEQTQVYNMEDARRNPDRKCNCCGTMVVFGKSLAVAPAHLLNAVIVCPLMMIYDIVLSIFFLLANVCTAFAIDELRERLSGHLLSTVRQPVEMFKNLFAGVCPPLAYRGDNAVQVNDRMLHTCKIPSEGNPTPRYALGPILQIDNVSQRSPMMIEALNNAQSLTV